VVTADEAAASEATLIVKETDTVRRETPVIVTSDDTQGLGDVVLDPQMFPALPATTGLKAFWSDVLKVVTPASSTEKAAACGVGSRNGALDGSFDGSLDG